MTSILKRLKAVSGLVLAIAVISSVYWRPILAAQVSDLRPPDTPIPSTLFGMHILHRFVPPYTAWPKVPFGSWRLWDTYTAWPSLEPAMGKWEFTRLDNYVDLAEQHHVEILLTLALSPTWASSRPNERSGYSVGNAAVPNNSADWRNYVQAVATRYKGRINDYEIWNEPNLKGFYTGSIPEMVTLAKVAYETLKKVDPSNIVTSPSATGASGLGWFDQYLKAGGGKYADVIAYHLYVNPAPPEEMVPLIQQVEQIMRNNGVGDKPLWDTETGWSIQNKEGTVKPVPGRGFNSYVLSESTAASYVARTYVLAWASGVSRLYWYGWDQGAMGLVDQDGKTLKVPAIAYGELEKWLVGATMTSCGSDVAGTWTCTITRPGGYHGWIMWNPAATGPLIKFAIPPSWHATRVRDLLGRVTNLAPGATLEVSYMPRLLEAPGR
jgi:hypothetical protein